MSTHLQRRGARYVYRRSIPQHLRAVAGRTEVVRSLGTSDRHEALKRSHIVAVEIDRLFESWAQATPVSARPDTWAGMQLEDWNVPDSELQPYTVDDRLDAILSEIRNAPVVAQIARTAAPEGKPAAVAPTGPSRTLSDALAEWTRLRKPVSTTVVMAERAINRFEAQHGRLPLGSITRQHFVSFANTQEGAASSTRVYISLLKALLTVSLDSGWIPANVATGLRSNVTTSAKLARLPFDTAELRSILSFADKQNDTRRLLIYLATYTGARIEELAQLRTTDIRTDKLPNGRQVSVIYITDDEPGQRIKNAASRRRVPVHSELIKIGFLDYANAQAPGPLFPTLTRNVHGKLSANFTNWFSTQLRTVLKITDKRKVFYSLRHNCKDALREARVPEQVSDALQGHTSGSVSRNYGAAFYPLAPLVEAIEALTFHMP